MSTRSLEWSSARWGRSCLLLTVIISALFFPFSNSVASNSELASMTDSELVALKKQLQKQSDDLAKEIESGFLQMHNASQALPSGNTGHKPLCMTIRETSNHTSPVVDAVAGGLSVVSSIFTSAGPVGELFHNYREYYRGSAAIPRTAYGQPSLDFASNGCYIVHLGLDWYNGGDSMTFFRNAFPSVVVMLIETGIVLSLVFYGYRRAHRAGSEEALLP